MAALAAPRRAAKLGVNGYPDFVQLRQLTNTVVYAGAIVVKDTAGYGKPGIVETTGVAAGVYKPDSALDEISNMTGVAQGSCRILKLEQGVFQFKVYGSDPVTIADIGKVVYIYDDQTIAATSGTGTRSVAGILIDMVSTGGDAWVLVGLQNIAQADYATLLALINAMKGNDGTSPETKTSGAISVATSVSKLSTTGTQAFTLADGTFTGQRKIIVCTVASTTPHGVLTPAHGLGWTSCDFTAVGQTLWLEWYTAGWYILPTITAPAVT